MASSDTSADAWQDEVARFRLGVLVNTRTSGGGQVFARELVRALAQHPASPYITLFVTGDTALTDWPPDVEIVPLGLTAGTLRSRILQTKAVRKALAAHPVQALLCPGTDVATNRDTPAVIWPLTVAPFERDALRLLGDTAARRARWRLLTIVLRRAFRSADAAIYSSQYARSVYERAIDRANRIPACVIHPAPSLQVNTTSDNSASSERTSRHFGSGPLLFVSHLYPYKMVVEMLEGYSILIGECQDTPDLLIAGHATNHAYEQRILETIDRLGLEDRVQLLGELGPQELRELYRSARVFVFPSISENAGSYALIDAFAHGVPVISSNTSSMPEICGDAALRFDPRRPDQLASRLRQILASPELEQRMAQLSLNRIHFFPDWDEIADDVLEFMIGIGQPSPSAGHEPA